MILMIELSITKRASFTTMPMEMVPELRCRLLLLVQQRHIQQTLFMGILQFIDITSLSNVNSHEF